jgi:nicotinamide-nucleotide amidase
LGDHVICSGRGNLAATLIELLSENGQTVTTAESCTGGRIASDLTAIAGASKVFNAGFVTYSNDMKCDLLSVNPATLAQYGAVSEQTVLEMAEGALARSGAHWGVAVSGIAGPDGGSDDKPVGTVWIAWGRRHQLKSRRLRIRMERTMFQKMVSAISLDLLRRDLLEVHEAPSYFGRYL